MDKIVRMLRVIYLKFERLNLLITNQIKTKKTDITIWYFKIIANPKKIPDKIEYLYLLFCISWFKILSKNMIPKINSTFIKHNQINIEIDKFSDEVRACKKA